MLVINQRGDRNQLLIGVTLVLANHVEGGVVAYQMLSGDLPFNASNTPALLVKHLSERPVPIDERRIDCPGDLARAVMLCLEKRPEDRFASAKAILHYSLDILLSGTPAGREKRLSTLPSGPWDCFKNTIGPAIFANFRI